MELSDSEEDSPTDIASEDFFEEDGSENKTTLIVTIPITSEERYESAYRKFISWKEKRSEEEFHIFSEDVFMMYFEHMYHDKQMKSSSLWCNYSMLKAKVFINHNVDISNYSKLKRFIKSRAVNHVPKKTKLFQTCQINDFLRNAPDDTYLLIKVALIISLAGQCRKQDLRNLKVAHLKDQNSILHISLPGFRNRAPRTITLTGFFYEIYKKYAVLRPANYDGPWFFLKYHKNRCYRAVVGVNTFGRMPLAIAKYLKLTDLDCYTSSSFRRSSHYVIEELNCFEVVATQSFGELESSLDSQHSESFNEEISSSVNDYEAPSSCHSFISDDNLLCINMNSDQLIELVKGYPFLYDVGHKEYGDYQKKEVVWKYIGSQLGSNEFDCKRAWALLRDAFRRAMKRHKETSAPLKKWKYEDEMSFLVPHLKERSGGKYSPQVNDHGYPGPSGAPLNDNSNSPPQGNNEILSPQNPHELLDSSVRNSTELTNKRRRLDDQSLSGQNDELQQFFNGMLLTVRKFPPRDQAIAKAKVFKIISDLEIEILSRPQNHHNHSNEQTIQLKNLTDLIYDPSSSYNTEVKTEYNSNYELSAQNFCQVEMKQNQMNPS